MSCANSSPRLRFGSAESSPVLNTASKFARKLLGSRNDRLLRRYQHTVEQINALEGQMQALDSDRLAGRTGEFRQQLESGRPLDELLPEAFAVAREASRRFLGMRPFDVQLVGALALHEGKIAEMRTGEGKTLVATLPAYLNALPPGKSVHVVTVNDYLARRDSDWMGRIYRNLGLEVGVITGSDEERAERINAYRADIVYGTNNEFGFDYLRDNMVLSVERKVQNALNFAIVDEVDSILIDEARTPLIISGPTKDDSSLYKRVDAIARKLRQAPPVGEDEIPDGDFTIDEKTRQAYLTEEGTDKVERLLMAAGLMEEGESLYNPIHINLVHHLNASLRAHSLFKLNVDYIIDSEGRVVIVDEFTGRTMSGRRWSDGLHQAVEAKEGVKIQQENQTFASITFQNYFRLYDKLSGMTGTASTEEREFMQIYRLEVVVIPTHMQMVRRDESDLIYLTEKAKYKAILADIEDCKARRQPVLVGTASIESSERLSNMLKKRSIAHEVLNAKRHEQEAQIIAQAGCPEAVTVATNMAGRGTDIVLGGRPDPDGSEGSEESGANGGRTAESNWEKRHAEVLQAGGLRIIGTERHDSRRIDNQLRGRSGRQGDPGSSRFYLSLEDNLMRIFGTDRMSGMMRKLGIKDDEAIEHRLVSKAIENAQSKVEGHNFDVRKHLLEYDDVANDQRRIIYSQRDSLLALENVRATGRAMREGVLDLFFAANFPEEGHGDWDMEQAEKEFAGQFGVAASVGQWMEEEEGAPLRLNPRLLEVIEASRQEKIDAVGAEYFEGFEQFIMLKMLDEHWRDHLAAMDHLRQSVGLRSYAQKNPMHEYKRDAFTMFSNLLDSTQKATVGFLGGIKPATVEEMLERERRHLQEKEAEAELAARQAHAAQAQEGAQPGEIGAQLEKTTLSGLGRRPKKGRKRAAVISGQHKLRPSGPAVQKSTSGASPRSPVPVAAGTAAAGKIARNAPCPCGSGRKYKHCCGAAQQAASS